VVIACMDGSKSGLLPWPPGVADRTQRGELCRSRTEDVSSVVVPMVESPKQPGHAPMLLLTGTARTARKPQWQLQWTRR
jgi:hypothetical protein